MIDATCAIQSMSGAFLVNQVGSQTDCTMLCLNFYTDKHSSLLANLPDFFIVTLNEQTLHPLVKLISNEAQNPNQIGNAFLVDNLAQSILVYMLHALPNEKLGGVSKAYQHPRLSELITQIAIETGFGSQTNFNRAFKAHYGISPSTYRLTPISMQ
ncbi:helix-turn-helix domain-containing protein [Moraxella bovis]|uniref:helix-turn-helix domain-containing protein n=1 Tax=Moraxella bovis TaxID=476 RepID=UPI002227EDE4|nr:helix-turn-helix domain-containing protein [Moraxella bovis]UZA33631.1 helix-turn-helix domain-containing protein [Moraxella bovis]